MGTENKQWAVMKTYQVILRRSFRKNDHQIIQVFNNYNDAVKFWKETYEKTLLYGIIDTKQNRNDFWGILSDDLRLWIHIEDITPNTKKYLKYKYLIDEFQNNDDNDKQDK